MPRRTAPKCNRRTAPVGTISMLEEMSLVWGTTIIPELELTTRDQFARPWADWGDEITRRWIDAMPGSRPFAMYILGLIPPATWEHEWPACRHPLRPIAGVDVVIPDAGWRRTLHELDHLETLGLIGNEERERAHQRLRSPCLEYWREYRWLHDPDE